MSARQSPDTPSGADEFARQSELPSASLVTQFWEFLRHSKKWWITPIVIVVLLVGIIVVLGSTAAAPFIYTIF